MIINNKICLQETWRVSFFSIHLITRSAERFVFACNTHCKHYCYDTSVFFRSLYLSTSSMLIWQITWPVLMVYLVVLSFISILVALWWHRLFFSHFCRGLLCRSSSASSQGLENCRSLFSLNCLNKVFFGLSMLFFISLWKS